MADNPAAEAYPWAPGSATGVGSMPGTDPAEAARVVTGELPGLPHLPELPARGPGADMAGRAAALLVDLAAELSPAGWRFASRPGRDIIRARAMLSADLDELEEAATGYQGPLKIQVCGPWTLAASIELARSQDPALADPGAVADLTASLAEGLSRHVAEVRKRLPGATVLLQLDEPSLPAVLAGAVPTASRLNRLPVPEQADVEERLRAVISATTAYSIVHCCARSVPFGIIASAGAGAAGFDLALLRHGEEDALAEALEAGLGVLAGVVPATPPPGSGAQRGTERSAPGQPPSARSAAELVTGWWRRMGWPGGGPDGASRQVVLTPACGLAGASPDYARAALARCREAARALPELIEEGAG